MTCATWRSGGPNGDGTSQLATTASTPSVAVSLSSAKRHDSLCLNVMTVVSSEGASDLARLPQKTEPLASAPVVESLAAGGHGDTGRGSPLALRRRLSTGLL